MVLSISRSVKKLWDSWNIKGFIMISLWQQAFLILCAPLRKHRRGKWGKCVDILIWSAYLLADWVAGVTIGYILSNQIKSSTEDKKFKVTISSTEESDIHVFWTPFLLLHLGGPDTITSFALEDNEFWVRHLLGLALQVTSTLYVFIMSLPKNKLWLPTLLVLIAGIIKYAERNRAFYLASFEHLGESWVASKWEDGIYIPGEFQNTDSQATFNLGSRSMVWSAVHHFGSIKRILVGPILSLNQCFDIRETFLQEEPSNALRIMEIELSLLYEVLHTKMPVVGCRIGYLFRVLSLVCILGALLSFSLLKNNYDELSLFDIWLTYGLLTGALSLDFISVILLILSDWIFVAHLQGMESAFDGQTMQSMESAYINRKRWSKAVSQLNFITYHIKDHSFGLHKVAKFLHMKGVWEEIKGIRCLSSQNFREDLEWRFIFEEVKQLNEYLIRIVKDSSKTVLEAKEVWLYSRERVLKYFRFSEELSQIINKFDYTESILTWHIASELCFQGVNQTPSADDKAIMCKKFSDFMFYLAVMQPSTMAAVSVNWKMVFEDTLKQLESVVPRRSISNEKDASRKILQLAAVDATDPDKSVLCVASKLASQLKQSDGTYPWKSMSKVWVQLMGFAAINCRPSVHAQQPSKGGELLTFVWLFMNHLGLGAHFSTHY